MNTIETTVTIARPPEEVFRFVSDLDNAPHWNVELISTDYERPMRKGSHGTDTRRLGSRQIEMAWEVVEFDAPRRMALRFEKPFGGVADFSFAPSEDGTVMSCSTTLSLGGWWRLLTPIIAREGKRADELQFQRIKEILEGTNDLTP